MDLRWKSDPDDSDHFDERGRCARVDEVICQARGHGVHLDCCLCLSRVIPGHTDPCVHAVVLCAVCCHTGSGFGFAPGPAPGPAPGFNRELTGHANLLCVRRFLFPLDFSGMMMDGGQQDGDHGWDRDPRHCSDRNHRLYQPNQIARHISLSLSLSRRARLRGGGIGLRGIGNRLTRKSKSTPENRNRERKREIPPGPEMREMTRTPVSEGHLPRRVAEGETISARAETLGDGTRYCRRVRARGRHVRNGHQPVLICFRSWAATLPRYVSIHDVGNQTTTDSCDRSYLVVACLPVCPSNLDNNHSPTLE